MKNLLLLAAFLMALGSCTRKLVTPQQELVLRDSMPVSDEIETDEVFVPKRMAGYPDFFDPNYRSYRVCTLYVDVSYNMFTRFGSQTESVVRKLFATCDTVMQNVVGPKLVIGGMKIHTTPDPYAIYTSAGVKLFHFSNNVEVQSRPERFKTGISSDPFGGIAYISRGFVTNQAYSYACINVHHIGNSKTYSFPVYVIVHELLHNLGLSHSHNDCAFLDRAGNRVGPLDKCAACESHCTPKTTGCNNTTIASDGGLNSYCHVYNRMRYMLRPEALAVVHRSLFESDLPTYTPTVTPPPPPVLTCSTLVAHTTAVGSHPGVGLALDGIDSTNTSRWVVKAPQTSLTLTYNNASVDCIRIWTGFLSGSTWSSPIRQAIVSVNGTQLVAVPGALEMTIPVNRSGVNTIRIDFFALDSHVRVREVRVLD
jgi:hypothetical protein